MVDGLLLRFINTCSSLCAISHKTPTLVNVGNMMGITFCHFISLKYGSSLEANQAQSCIKKIEGSLEMSRTRDKTSRSQSDTGRRSLFSVSLGRYKVGVCNALSV
jgi:hypothetical protein